MTVTLLCLFSRGRRRRTGSLQQWHGPDFLYRPFCWTGHPLRTPSVSDRLPRAGRTSRARLIHQTREPRWRTLAIIDSDAKPVAAFQKANIRAECRDFSRPCSSGELLYFRADQPRQSENEGGDREGRRTAAAVRMRFGGTSQGQPETRTRPAGVRFGGAKA